MTAAPPCCAPGCTCGGAYCESSCACSRSLTETYTCPRCGNEVVVAERDAHDRWCEPRRVHFVDSQGRPLAGSAALYGWIIDRETVSTEQDEDITPANRTPSRVGWFGPRDIAPAIEQQLRNGQGQRFRMFDDDGNLYYEGRYIGPDDETAFGPLTDLGTPDAGATRIDYQGRNGRWATL